MAPYNVDIKLKMDRFAMQAGPDARRFRTDLLSLSPPTDDRGFTLADCLLRMDEGATDAAGNPLPGAPALPGGAAALAKAMAALRARKKNSFTYIVTHVDCRMSVELFGEPNGPYYQTPDARSMRIGRWVMNALKR